MLSLRDYGVKDVTMSTKAPNVNAIAERCVRSARNEVLDTFVLFGRKHIEHIPSRHILYFNGQRPHKGIEQHVPGGYGLSPAICDMRSKAVSITDN